VRTVEFFVTMRRSMIPLLLLTACDPGDVVLVSPEKSGAEGPSLSVRAVVDTPYVALAESLGWTAGVPGAQVRVHRMVEPYDESYWVTAVADSTGVVAFFDLLAGQYEVEVSRTLDSAETAQGQGVVQILAGGRRMWMSPPAPDVLEVTMAPDGRGALVFGEFSLALPVPWDIPAEGSFDARYFEVHNNTDTTIYLDSKYWGVGWENIFDQSWGPCAETEVVRNDPEGIWTRIVFRFPGMGNDYPLDPGRTALVAKAAIDHREVHPDLNDLRHADFEVGGSFSADNPDVPNLQGIGLEVAYAFVPIVRLLSFLSESVDLGTLPRYVDPVNGETWVRIPRALVLDVWVGMIDWTTHNHQTVPSCLEATHRYFERLPGPADYLSDFYEALSFQRRVLTVLPDGRTVLQDTNTSMVDFVKALWTPGWVPDSLL
jgi:hypothetical protein